MAVAGGYAEVAALLVEEGGANVNLPLAITDDELAALSPAEAEGLQCAGSGEGGVSGPMSLEEVELD